MGDKRAELSYTSAVSDTPLLGDTIGANFDRAVTAFPDRLALVDVPAGLRYTYAELKDEVDALAYALRQAGIVKAPSRPGCERRQVHGLLPYRLLPVVSRPRGRERCATVHQRIRVRARSESADREL